MSLKARQNVAFEKLRTEESEPRFASLPYRLPSEPVANSNLSSITMTSLRVLIAVLILASLTIECKAEVHKQNFKGLGANVDAKFDDQQLRDIKKASGHLASSNVVVVGLITAVAIVLNYNFH